MATSNLGTPLTMAPEVLDNKEYSAKVDLWSIGCVLFKLLFGKDPFFAFDRPSLRSLIQQYNGLRLRIPISPSVSEPVALFFISDSFFWLKNR
jgi:serine/threonine protein kinase